MLLRCCNLSLRPGIPLTSAVSHGSGDGGSGKRLTGKVETTLGVFVGSAALKEKGAQKGEEATWSLPHPTDQKCAHARDNLNGRSDRQKTLLPSTTPTSKARGKDLLDCISFPHIRIRVKALS